MSAIDRAIEGLAEELRMLDELIELAETLALTEPQPSAQIGPHAKPCRCRTVLLSEPDRNESSRRDATNSKT